MAGGVTHISGIALPPSIRHIVLQLEPLVFVSWADPQEVKALI